MQAVAAVPAVSPAHLFRLLPRRTSRIARAPSHLELAIGLDFIGSGTTDLQILGFKSQEVHEETICEIRLCSEISDW